VRCFHVDAATNMRNVLPVARVLLVFEHEVQRLLGIFFILTFFLKKQLRNKSY
jgi:hypothetical protein